MAGRYVGGAWRWKTEWIVVATRMVLDVQNLKWWVFLSNTEYHCVEPGRLTIWSQSFGEDLVANFILASR